MIFFEPYPLPIPSIDSDEVVFDVLVLIEINSNFEFVERLSRVESIESSESKNTIGVTHDFSIYFSSHHLISHLSSLISHLSSLISTIITTITHHRSTVANNKKRRTRGPKA
jgi:hypothetical protein